MDRLFLDANVLFSAAYRSNSGLLRLWKLPNTELLTSDYAVEEARSNLTERGQLEHLVTLITRVRIVTGVSPLPVKLKLPEKDWPILQAAIYARATHLLTGDKRHFGPYFGKYLEGVLVLPPGDYLQQRAP